MSNKEINIAIAEILGWTAPVGWDGHWPERQHYSVPGCQSVTHGVPPGKKQKDYPYGVGAQDNLEPVPNYAGDLNAMHEAEEKLNRQWRTYVDWLVIVVFGRGFDSLIYHAYVINATARQRAEAFLRTIGKWKEGA